MSSILRREGRGSNKRKVFFVLYMVMLCLGITSTTWAALNDVAIYRPGIQGGMSVSDQTTTATYIYDNIAPVSKVMYAGYDQTLINSLTGWMNSHRDDGQSDLLVIIDIIPAALFQGETDGSLAEQWLDSGNMLIWTGSEPFANYVDTDGIVSTADAGTHGASKVLDVSSSGLCRGGGLQKGTSAVFFQYHDELGELQTDPDGDYDISSFVEYTAKNALNYSKLLIDAIDSDWHHMSYWKVDEVFAEDSESYQSDNIVLVNADGGQFAQFYTTTDLNDERKQVITQVINNWVALPCNTLTVDDDFINPGPNEFTTIQAAIDAAQPRDTILVKPGHYNEQLDLKTNTPLGTRGIKIVSDGNNEFLDPGNPDDVALMNSNVDVCSPGRDPADIAQWKQQWSDGRPGYAESYAVAYGIDVESKKVLKRAARTIIYGTGYPGGTEGKPMVDFALGSTVGTMLDGFTVCDMPTVNHVIPGHAHVVQTRGGSATVVNDIVYNNGSSGLGSHAWFYDQNNDIETRDFRFPNIMHDAHPVLINNVVFRNEGNNLGNNHYSYALMYNNELFESISVDDHESPGIGCQHGAHPLIDGNLVYKSDWVGIGGRKGEEQGTYPINRPTHPIVRNNKVFDAGENDTSASKPPGYPFPGEHGAGIGGDDTGGWDPKTKEFKYHIIENNYVNGAKNAAIGVRSINPAYGNLPPDAGDDYPPDLGFVKIIDNEATGGGTGTMGAGIGLNGAHAVEISNNITYGNNEAGIGIRGSGSANLIANNESYDNGMAGIGMKEGASVGTITLNNLHNNAMAGIGHDGSGGWVNVTLESDNTIAYNGAAGIGIQASDIGEISYNTIEHNTAPGITVTEGTIVSLIYDNTLDYNGTSNATGFSIHASTVETIQKTTISNSGTTNMSIFDSTATLIDCTLYNSSSPNMMVTNGSIVTVEDSLIDTTIAGPNLHIADSETVFTLIGSTVTHSATPGLYTAANPTLNIRDTVFDHNGTSGTAHLDITSCTGLDFDNVTVSNSYKWSFIANCNGSIRNSEFHDIDTFASGEKEFGGGMVWITNSTMDITNNVIHDPGFLAEFLKVVDSTVNVYHNTIVGRAELGGPWAHGPAWGLIVLGDSTADVRNNIFYKLPNGLGFDEYATVTASTNCFKWIHHDGIYGDNIIEENPYLMGDFTLDYYSPLIDAGELIPGYNDDYNGYAPDVGAKESPWLRPDLFWESPKECYFQTIGGTSVPEIVDEELSTANPEGYPVIICKIDDEPKQVYGARFYYTDTREDTWDIKVSTDPGGPWTDISQVDGVILGIEDTGVWQEWSADYLYPENNWQYIMFSFRGDPLPSNTLYEVDLLTRGDLLVPSKYGTIQAAIDAAVDGDYVFVSDGTYSENINFLNKMITVKSINGPASTVIQGDGSDKPVVKFVSGEGSYSVLNGFTLDNQNNAGYYTRGLQIVNSSPTIKNCIIQDNKVIWARDGGGVYISGGGATIENTVIGGSEETKNSARFGGGIYFINSTDGTLKISDSTISHNGYYGGCGMFLSNINNTTTIANSSISNNICTSNKYHAGGIYSNNAPLLITDSHVDNNRAWDGGGIYVSGDTTSATIIGSTISGNTGRYGGGICFGGTTNGSLLISDSTIDGNSCGYHGGGIYSKHQATITNSIISNNSSAYDGAGLYHFGDSPNVIIENSIFDGNSGRMGGAMCFAGSNGGYLSISDSAIFNNIGNAKAGGLQLYGNTGTATANIERTVITGNKASGAAGEGGGVYVYSGTGASILSTFKNCTVTGNQSPSSYGGGFWISGSGTAADIINCTISGNYAEVGGGMNAGSNTNVINSILWGNSSAYPWAYNEVFGSPNITYSDVQGGYSGTGNIYIDPLFVNPIDAALAPTSDGDYHIQWSSPVIDQGTSSGAPSDDIDGDSRPAGDGIDMGSDESSP